MLVLGVVVLRGGLAIWGLLYCSFCGCAVVLWLGWVGLGWSYVLDFSVGGLADIAWFCGAFGWVVSCLFCSDVGLV